MTLLTVISFYLFVNVIYLLISYLLSLFNSCNRLETYEYLFLFNYILGSFPLFLSLSIFLFLPFLILYPMKGT